MLGEDKQICLSLATHKREPLFCLNRMFNWPGYSPFFKHLFTREKILILTPLKKKSTGFLSEEPTELSWLWFRKRFDSPARSGMIWRLKSAAWHRDLDLL